MPENFIQPVTDRQVCFKCNKTVTGKRKLSKCSRCHAITYCGAACQKADWDRHKWNCVHVMLTKFEGKGRGVVAARDIKMGEFIFLDKPAIKLPIRSSFNKNLRIFEQLSSEDLNSLMRQVNNLTSEAMLLFYKLEDFHEDFLGEWAKDGIIFSQNASITCKELILFLNSTLINHTCAPNAYDQKTEDGNIEVRAIKDISRGEEITKFYGWDEDFTYKQFGCNVKERKKVIWETLGFDCMCSVCIGDVPDQKDILKELLELHDNHDPDTAIHIINELLELHDNLDRETILSDVKLSILVQAIDKMVDLNLILNVGSIADKVWALKMMAETAYLIQDEDRLEIAKKQLKKIAEDTKLVRAMNYLEVMRKYFS